MVIGIDNLNDYYDVNLKLVWLKCLEDIEFFGSFEFVKFGVEECDGMEVLFEI